MGGVGCKYLMEQEVRDIFVVRESPPGGGQNGGSRRARSPFAVSGSRLSISISAGFLVAEGWPDQGVMAASADRFDAGRLRGFGRDGTRKALDFFCHRRCSILNHLVQYEQPDLDAAFSALADATRRGVLEQLGREEASISMLAERFHMSLTGMKKHVGVLERAGLVRTEKVGRVRTCKLGRHGLGDEAAWIERYRQLWAARFDALDVVVEELKQKEKADGLPKRK
jgi:DNA-binding transcriptional ArsR family regulator